MINKDQKIGSQKSLHTKDEMIALFEEEVARSLGNSTRDDEKQRLEKSLARVREILNKEHVLREVQKQPEILGVFLLEYDRGIEYFDDENWVKNFVMRINEKRENGQEVKKRVIENPLATDEEFSAGVYKEGLERQVRDAVFEFRKKGYNTIESGFVPGMLSQEISFATTEGFILPSEIKDYLFSVNVNIDFRKYSSPISQTIRDIIILTPQNWLPTLDEWKAIWDEVARLMPNQGGPAKYGLTGAGKEFRKKQKSLRQN